MLLWLGRAPAMGCLCAQQTAAESPSNPPQKYFLAFPFSLAEEADGGCCRDREEQPARPVPEPGLVWSDEDLKSSSSAPALELITGSQLWQQGPESCWSAPCNPQAVCPTLPALFIQEPPDCQLRITALLSPPGCLCKLDAPAASHRAASWVTTCTAEAFYPWEREEANEKEYSAPLSPAHLLQSIKPGGKMLPWISCTGQVFCPSWYIWDSFYM